MKISGYQTQALRVTFEESVTGMHVLLRLRTDDGIEGISYVSRIGAQTMKPLVMILEGYCEQVMGADPMQTEAVYAQLHRSVGTVAGLEARAASAIDAALWDIKGKALAQPVYKLMGGFRSRVPVSANWGVQHGPSAETVTTNAKDLLDRGFRALKFQVGALDRESAVKHFQVMRDAVGPDVKLIVDANQRWNVKQALIMGKALAPFNPYWIEDPVPHYDYEGLRRVKDELETMICAGEVFHSVPQFRQLLEHGSSDVAMVDLDLGLTGFLKVAHMAEAYGVPLVNHLNSETLAHGIAAVPNGLIVGYYPWAQPLWTEGPRIEDGELVMSEKPGLGLELDEAAVAKFELK
jgi:L-alanine-DL-glutamate epimerase-like enolase superfamily enzyme